MLAASGRSALVPAVWALQSAAVRSKAFCWVHDKHRSPGSKLQVM
jgi:hypothetical protein